MLLETKTKNSTSGINNKEHFPCWGKTVYNVLQIFIVFNILTVDMS